MSAIEPHHCPRCLYPIDSASTIQGQEVSPKPGDLTVCLWCGAPMQFEAHGAPRWLTVEEVTALPIPARGKLAQAWAAVLTYRPSRVRWIEREERR